MPKRKWGVSNKGRGKVELSSQSKEKETISVELSGEALSKLRRVAMVIRSSSFL